MTQEAINNGIVLYNLDLDRMQIEEALRVINLVPQLLEILESPIIAGEKKHAIIDKIYSGYDCPKKLVNFIKVMCDHHRLYEIADIYAAYCDYWDEQNNIKRVKCIFSKEPDNDKMEQIQDFLRKKYADKKLVFDICIDPDILGGVVIRIGHEEYNRSFEDKIRQLETVILGK